MKKALGATRFQYWKDGKLSVNDLVNQRGRELTLAELRKEYNLPDA